MKKIKSSNSHKKPFTQVEDIQQTSSATCKRSTMVSHQPFDACIAESGESGHTKSQPAPYWKATAKGITRDSLEKMADEEDKSDSLLHKENEYLCSECRTSKIDSHLMTLKKLREKALRYTNQLDEIRFATKKREKELMNVMERLQTEEKNLHEQLENVDQLSYKMNIRRNQLRQEQMSLQHDESEMAERLQALKEKEIFVNCQMVKLQSQETAIKHRKKELQKEKLRIEKLAYLIFKTDLSTMTYKEFKGKIGKMQVQLENRYRKLKVMEHYCQHKSLPAGMKLEPITPIEQCLDPAVAAFEEVLWGNKNNEDRSSSSVQIFSKDSRDNYVANPSNNKGKRDMKEYSRNSIIRSKDLGQGKKQSESHFQTERNSRTITVSSRSENVSKHSRIFNMTTKKSKSEQRQECKIVKEEANTLQRLIMSAKETSASVHRLLQTPIPEIGDEKLPVAVGSQNSGFSCASNADEEEIMQEDYEEHDDEEEQADENEDDSEESCSTDVHEELQDQFSSSDNEGQDDIEDETELIHKRITKLEHGGIFRQIGENALKKNSSLSRDTPKKTDTGRSDSTEEDSAADENGVCSIFRNIKNDEEKISSQSLIHPEPNDCTVPFKYRWKKSSEESVDGSDQVTNRRKRRPRSGERLTMNTNRSPEKPQNGGDRFDYEDLVNDRLSRLSETTRNEIVYAIGQKALAQVVQAMDRSAKHVDHPPSKHGDQGSGSHYSEHKQSSKEGPGRPSNVTETYLQTIRRGLKSPVKKCPKKIPSHLKFGKFNIKHRGRKLSDTYRQISQPNPYDSRLLEPSDSISETQPPVEQCSSQDMENAVLDLENDFQGENYSADVIAEKILGIHSSANPCRRREKEAAKLSHHRAFRV